MEPTILSWQAELQLAVASFVHYAVLPKDTEIDPSHITDTPARVVQTFQEMIAGYKVDPGDYLVKRFHQGSYDEMIHVRDVRIISTCAHHLKPILGKAHFAYVPGEYIVGLSKIPRMIDALSRRLQVQENLTEQIVDIFEEVVKPKGCAVNIRAYHLCVMARGAEENDMSMETTALRGVFRKLPEARQEFLASIDRIGRIFP